MLSEECRKFIEKLNVVVQGYKIHGGAKVEGTASILDYLEPEVRAEIVAREEAKVKGAKHAE